MPLTTYCVEADLERYLSAQGVIAFADHDSDGDSDTGVVNDCIAQAAEEINLYANQYYSAAALATSTLIVRWATVLASAFLCQRRGNPVPDSLQAEFTRIMETLERIRKGEMRIPGIAWKSDFRPTVSNVVVDRGACDGPVRVDTATSPNIPTTLTRKALRDGGRRRYG